MDSVEIGTNVSEIRETKSNLSSRISRLEESVNLNHVSEALCRIIRLEESVGHVVNLSESTRWTSVLPILTG